MSTTTTWPRPVRLVPNTLAAMPEVLDRGATCVLHVRKGIFFADHPAFHAEIADRVVVMQQGEVRESGPAAEVLGAPRHPYTRALLRCRPRIDQRPSRLPVIEDFLGGEPPEEPDVSFRLARPAGPGAPPRGAPGA